MDSLKNKQNISNAYQEQVPENPPVWGLKATIGFSMLIGLVFFIGQMVGMGLSTFNQIQQEYDEIKSFELDGGQLTINEQPTDIQPYLDAHILSVATAVSGIICLGLILLIIKYREQATIKSYLNFYPVKVKTLLFWLGLLTIYIGLEHLLSNAFPVFESDFVTRVYESADSLLFLIIAVGIIAPVFEECFFRGFLFKGLECSRVGGWGAVIITTLLFVSIHLQYNFAVLVLLLPLGFMLGISRFYTQSLWPPVILHMANNIVVTLIVAGGG